MDLKERLLEEYKVAMKARERLKVSTIRMLQSEIRNAEIAKRGELTEEELLGVVSREARKRREAIEEFEKAGRQDLADRERFELSIIQEYMPEQLSQEEVRRMAEEAIREVGATSPGDIGRVMGQLMPRLKGKADGRQVNQMVREMLQG